MKFEIQRREDTPWFSLYFIRISFLISWQEMTALIPPHPSSLRVRILISVSSDWVDFELASIFQKSLHFSNYLPLEPGFLFLEVLKFEKG